MSFLNLFIENNLGSNMLIVQQKQMTHEEVYS